MQNHLDLHNFEHQERVKNAEQYREAKQAREENRKPNQVALKLGELLVDAGEQLIKHEQQPKRALQ